MKDSYYFPHDSNAHADQRMLILRGEMGLEAYGAYWILIEMMREDENLSIANDIRTLKGIAMLMGIDYVELSNIIALCIEIGLFTNENSTITSPSLQRRMAHINEVRGKRKASAEQRWSKSNANALHTHSESNAIKEKKSKVKDIQPRFAPPSVDDVIAYFISRGSDAYQANQFHNYYSSNGWKVGKSNMKDWQAAARNWIGRNKAEQPTEAPKPQKPEVVWVTVAELNREQQEKFMELCGGKWKNDVIYQGKKYCFRF